MAKRRLDSDENKRFSESYCLVFKVLDLTSLWHTPADDCCIGQQASKGTILVYGVCDFPHFFNMAAHLNHTTTSCYHAIVGLTNLTPVIQTQTFHQYKSCNAVLRQYGIAQLTTQ